MINYVNLFKENNLTKKTSDISYLEFISENITTNKIDYYYSNVIARASKNNEKMS